MPIRSTLVARFSKAAALIALIVIALLVKGAPLAPIATPSAAADQQEAATDQPVVANRQPAPTKEPHPITIQAGDRVVLVGNTLIERDQRYGYFETAVTAKLHGNVTFRNLGWCGDTVWGESRATFDPLPEGYRRLKESVIAAKPTVLIIGYGTNESFAGEAGLPHFVDGLNRLLDDLEKTKARIVLLSPLAEEDLGRPLPDPTEQNKRLALYREAIRDVARRRNCMVVDLFDTLIQAAKRTRKPLTDDELHLTERGYLKFGDALAAELDCGPDAWRLSLDATSGHVTSAGMHTSARDKQPDGSWRLDVTDKQLLPPNQVCNVRIMGLPAGRYWLEIDGQTVAEETAADWANWQQIRSVPSFDATRKLQQMINRKNRLFMSRWRPQNSVWLVTYPEQQRMNVGEIPAFDPLIAAAERQIAAAAVPQRHTYRLTRAPDMQPGEGQ